MIQVADATCWSYIVARLRLGRRLRSPGAPVSSAWECAHLCLLILAVTVLASAGHASLNGSSCACYAEVVSPSIVVLGVTLGRSLALTLLFCHPHFVPLLLTLAAVVVPRSSVGCGVSFGDARLGLSS